MIDREKVMSELLEKADAAGAGGWCTVSEKLLRETIQMIVEDGRNIRNLLDAWRDAHGKIDRGRGK